MAPRSLLRLNSMKIALDNRTQLVVLNGQYSLWAKVEAGVSQGSIVGPLLFLRFIRKLIIMHQFFC